MRCGLSLNGYHSDVSTGSSESLSFLFVGGGGKVISLPSKYFKCVEKCSQVFQIIFLLSGKILKSVLHSAQFGAGKQKIHPISMHLLWVTEIFSKYLQPVLFI